MVFAIETQSLNNQILNEMKKKSTVLLRINDARNFSKRISVIKIWVIIREEFINEVKIRYSKLNIINTFHCP